ncbi:MAG: hypothetical protein OJF48_004568 [Afipia sp.]|nr:MAG: hypothetical protein OJF48_004568 [Afipia sp.]
MIVIVVMVVAVMMVTMAVVMVVVIGSAHGTKDSPARLDVSRAGSSPQQDVICRRAGSSRVSP